ncbi:MAG: primosomal protein N', partial [Deltaproteobacteria bacterium]
MFADVIINSPTNKPYTYRIPDQFKDFVSIGVRVLVPLRGRKATGFIVNISEDSDVKDTKEIMALTDDIPLFSTDDLHFYKWMSEYYIYPLGFFLHELLPSGTDTKTQLYIERIPHLDNMRLSPRQRIIMTHLANNPAPMPLTVLEKALNMTKLNTCIKTMEKRALLKITAVVEKAKISPHKEMFISIINTNTVFPEVRGEKQKQLLMALATGESISLIQLKNQFGNITTTIKTLIRKGLIKIEWQETSRTHKEPKIGLSEKGKVVKLNEEQSYALSEIEKSISSGMFNAHLLHGVTGSGKTEVYLRSMQFALNNGGSTMYLVPEIALTPQLESRIRSKFDIPFAIIHSNIKNTIRFDQWRDISQGKIKLVIGARSALFAPLKNLKLIIVDEEHDGSYKQDDRLRYNARDAAIIKAKQNSATVVLGSATPSLQTFYNASIGKYKYLNLPSRVANRPLPSVEIVDIRNTAGAGNIPLISPLLKNAIMETLSKKEQVLLFLNRRGFNTYTVCSACGETIKCPNCDIALTHHLNENALKCHLCGFSSVFERKCPHCASSQIVNYGAGTEKLLHEVIRYFPSARAERMDSDTTVKAGEHLNILKRMENKEIDILVGTQMIAKGHDFPNITLVGVVLADIGMGLPDFRATEKTFQFLMQVAGRGGRGEALGRVIIQTLNPEHYAIKQLSSHDYEGFYVREIASR